MSDCYSVYVHIFPNGKKYFGITSNKPKKRWNYGVGYRDQPVIYHAIKKYGWNNIKHIILYENLTKGQACEKEKKLIKKFNTTNRKNGYNVSFGGEDGCAGLKRTEQQRKIIKEKCTEVLGKKVIQFILDDADNLLEVRTYKSIKKASEATKQSKGTISKKCSKEWCYDYYFENSRLKEWAFLDDYYKSKLLYISKVDHYLYNFLLRKGIRDERIIVFMGADIEFWRKLTKYEKKQKSPVKVQ